MTGYFIALDLGEVRVGIAKSDPLGFMAIPQPFVPFNDLLPFLDHLEPGCKGLIVGHPLNLKGESAQKAQWVETIIGSIREAKPDLPVILVDERFTTSIASQKLIESGMSRKKRQEKGRVDSWAAAEILQSYLDRKPGF